MLDEIEKLIAESQETTAFDIPTSEQTKTEKTTKDGVLKIKNIFEVGFTNETTLEEYRLNYHHLFDPIRLLPKEQFDCWNDYTSNGELLYNHATEDEELFLNNLPKLLIRLENYNNIEAQYKLAKEAFELLKHGFIAKGGGINSLSFERYLLSQGYCNISLLNNLVLVKITDNIVSKVSISEIILFVKQKIENILSKSDFLGLTERAQNKMWTKLSSPIIANIIKTIKCKDVTFLQSSKQGVYFCFLNGYVLVRKDGITTSTNYKSLYPSVIWESSVIKHCINFDRPFFEQQKESNFYKFVQNLATHKLIFSKESFDNITTGLGYLISGFQDPVNPKIVVITENNDVENLSDSKGGTGKSLLTEAVKHTRKTCHISGKLWRPTSDFLFQRVEEDTAIIRIDDVRESFRLDDLYDSVTNGLIVNKKGKHEICFDFAHSPKFVLTSNFPIRGVDDSSLRRRFDIEISRYYDLQHRPSDDFGVFFSDWTEQDWQTFYAFMIVCNWAYLKQGLVEHSQKEIMLKSIYNEVGLPVVEIVKIMISEYTDTAKDKGIIHYSKDDLLQIYRQYASKDEPIQSIIRKTKKLLNAQNYELISTRATGGDRAYSWSIKEKQND